MVRKRFDDERRQELLDGVMGIIAARGFSDITVSEIARELHCSASSLYKIAASKDSLIVLAVTSWFDRNLEDMETRALRGATAVDRARIYWQDAAEHIRQLSPAFRRDVERFDSIAAGLSKWIRPFCRSVRCAPRRRCEAGEIEPMNTRFLAHVLRQAAFVVRDERVLSGLRIRRQNEAMLELDHIIWDGIRTKGETG